MILLILFYWLFIFVRPVHAYLDPGTGSYITQVMVGLFAGGAYAVKVYWRQIISFFKKIISRPKTPPQNESK